MTDVHLLPFVAVTALIVVTPGVDMALVTKNAITGGRRAALATALGVNAGVAAWIAASALGIATLVRESSTTFDVLKIAGAISLTVLGVRSLRGGRAGAPPGSREAPHSCFRQGVLNNLLNPKMGIIFVSLVPQFVDRGSAAAGSLLLGGSFLAMGVLWLCAYALLAVRAAGILRRPRIRARVDQVTGAVLIGLAVRVATERR